MMRIPAELEKKMKLWREGHIAMPKEYIEFHEKEAKKSLESDLAGFTIHRVYQAGDGWGDGMQFTHVIIEDKNGELSKIKWSDSGHWYKHMPSGGWGLWKLTKAA